MPVADPREFAPGLLRVQEVPPHPAARAVLLVLLALFGGLLVWAVVGRLDIIAVAQGKLVPVSYLQIVQPSESGIVKELLVRDGEEVTAGQILMRLDTSISDAEIRQLQNDLLVRSLQLRRIDGELGGGRLPRNSGDPPALFAQAEAQLRDRRQAYLDALETERAVLAKAEQDLKSAGETEVKLKQTLPMYQEQERAFDKLGKDGFAGRIMVLEKQRDRIEKEQDLKSQEFNIASLKASIEQSSKRSAQVTSSYRQQLQNERVEAESQLHRLQQELDKQAHRHELLELRAPRDGFVKDLAARTVGSVLAPGAVVLTLLPKNDRLQAEVWVTNQDAGFVRQGQPVKVKFAAYPFQKYGMADARVEQVSPDASELPQASNIEKKKGDVEHVPPPTGYRVLVALNAPLLRREGADYLLSSGMQVVAEIHLGTRTILEYIISPVQKVSHEAWRER